MTTSKRDGAAGLVLGYEAVALLSGGRLPTISTLCGQHRWLSAVTVGVLVVHLVQADMASAPEPKLALVSGWLQWHLREKRQAHLAMEQMEQRRAAEKPGRNTWKWH